MAGALFGPFNALLLSHEYAVILLLVVGKDILLDAPSAAIPQRSFAVVHGRFQYAVPAGLALVFVEFSFGICFAGGRRQEYLVGGTFTCIHLESFVIIALICSLLHLDTEARLIFFPSRVRQTLLMYRLLFDITNNACLVSIVFVLLLLEIEQTLCPLNPLLIILVALLLKLR